VGLEVQDSQPELVGFLVFSVAQHTNISVLFDD
jgi:hypothetical protein